MSVSRKYDRQQNYYMPGSAALAPEFYEPWEQITDSPKQKKKVSPLHGLSFANVRCCAIIFLLATLVVGQCVYIAALGNSIVHTEKELGIVLNENEKMKQSCANLGELSAIENYAVNTLGMVKADSSMYYVAQANTVNETISVETSVNHGFFGNVWQQVEQFFTAF